MQQIIDTRAAAHRNNRGSFASKLLRRILDADQRHRERRALQRLSDEQLDDVGVTRKKMELMIRHDL